MSDGNIDSDNQRSRSIFRHVRESFTSISRHRSHLKARTVSPPSTPATTKRASIDHIDVGNSSIKTHSKRSTPISFSHHLSLLTQVKSRFHKNRKFPNTQASSNNEDYAHLSLPSVIPTAESKSSTTFASNSSTNAVDLHASKRLINTMLQNSDQEMNDQHYSINTVASDDDDDDDVPELFQSSNDGTRIINTSRVNVSKTRGLRTRPSLAKSSSITSIATSISLPTNTPEAVYFVELCIDRGKELSIKDLNGTSDPYVKVYYGTEEKYVTNTIFKNLNPIWNERASFFVQDLNVPVGFYLFDYDRIGRDEPMGYTKIDLCKLPIGEAYNAALELKNEKRADGKTGTLIVSVTLTQKSSEFRDEVMRTLSKQSNRKVSLTSRMGGSNAAVLTRRTIDVFVIEGRNLTMAGSANKVFSPYVRLKFGANKKYRTQTIKSNANPKWHQSFLYETIVNELPPLELTVVDDTGGSGDSMSRGVCNLAHLDEERTHRISVDLDDNAGVIDLFVTITGISPPQELTNDVETASSTSLEIIPSRITDEESQGYSFMSTLRSVRPLLDVGLVEIKIYQARDLSAKDINGKSDPFCVIELDSTRLRTHTIYKTLDPVWNKSFIIPVQDIHSILVLTIYDEDMNKSTEFIGRIVVPLLAIINGEKKWMALKDRKCVLPVKGMLEVEATLIYSNVRAVIRTFNPRQVQYYQQDGKFRVAVFKQHINRVRSSLMTMVNVVKFINYCFQWENPFLSLIAFITSLVIVWNFKLYMLPCALLLLFAWNALEQYRRGTLGKPFLTLGDEIVSSVVQPMGAADDEALDMDMNGKEQKKSLMGVIHNIQDTVLEIQGYVDKVASTLERIKNVFNFTVPWLSILAITVLTIASILLYSIPLRYLVLAFVINKFTKRFRKPKGYIDNNELADFLSRLPSDPELLQYREVKTLSRTPTPKKGRRLPSSGK